jgi:hypothetical protein
VRNARHLRGYQVDIKFKTVLLLSCAPHAKPFPEQFKWDKTLMNWPDAGMKKVFAETGPKPSADEVKGTTVKIRKTQADVMLAKLPAIAVSGLETYGPGFRAERNYMWSVDGVVVDAICCPDFLERWQEADRGNGSFGPNRCRVRFMQVHSRESQQQRERRERLAALETPPADFERFESQKVFAAAPLGHSVAHAAAVKLAREEYHNAKTELDKRYAADDGRLKQECREKIWAADDEYARPRTQFNSVVL